MLTSKLKNHIINTYLSIEDKGIVSDLYRNNDPTTKWCRITTEFPPESFVYDELVDYHMEMVFIRCQNDLSDLDEPNQYDGA